MLQIFSFFSSPYAMACPPFLNAHRLSFFPTEGPLHHWQWCVISVSAMFPNSRPSHGITKGSRGVTSDTDRHMLEGHWELSIHREKERAIERLGAYQLNLAWWISRHLTDKERQANKQWEKKEEMVGEIGSDMVTAVVLCLSITFFFC